MPCYTPLSGYRDRETGKLTFQFNLLWAAEPLTVPCGQCIGCRIDRSRSWAIRCVHEAQLHKENCFLTLTYNDEHLPHSGSLDKTHFQDFMKALRHQNTGKTIRYFMCGEYGEKNLRPHYHACIFGLHFNDKQLWKKRNGTPLFRSPKLETIWPHGFSTIGEVTWESAAYCARYIMKKINGDKAEEHYETVNSDGEVFDLLPEYTHQSNRPGLGKAWFDKYHTDVFPDDCIRLANGKRYTVPRYYDKLMELRNPELLAATKIKREEYAALNKENNTPSRLRVRQICKERQVERLKREMLDT